MPTPFEEMPNAEGGARNEAKPRSVFSNFDSSSQQVTKASEGGDSPPAAGEEAPPIHQGPVTDDHPNPALRTPHSALLQAAIDEAIARAFIYRYLAKAYEYPDAEGWQWLAEDAVRSALQSAINTLAPGDISSLGQKAEALASRLNPLHFEAFVGDYVTVFGHAARGSCPLNEIEYGDLKADPLFQPHRLADVAAFYRAFGLEVAADATERQDHICLELEFMSVLASKEAYTLEHQLDDDALALCRSAQKDFLREHLGRWTPAFARRLACAVGPGPLGLLAELTREFIELDCRGFRVTPGSEDLQLRPIDESADSLCASCGIHNLPPGALNAAAQL